MTVITRENAETFTAFRKLIEGISREELLSHVLELSKSYHLGFTLELAGEFLDELKNKELDENGYNKGKFWGFVSFYLAGLVSDYTWRAWDINKKELENWKYWKNNEKEKEAKEYRENTAKEGYKKAFINYYKTQDLEELRKHIHFGYYRDNDAMKTLSKIDNKLKTKSHTLEKIEKLLDEEVNDYRRRIYYTHTEEERAEHTRIEKSAGFSD